LTKIAIFDQNFDYNIFSNLFFILFFENLSIATGAAMPAIKQALTSKHNRPVLGVISQNVTRSTNNSTQPLKPPRIALSQATKVNVFQVFFDIFFEMFIF